MGYEAYKITAKIPKLSKEDVMAALRRHGAVPVEEFAGTATMEKTSANGVIELILRDESHVNMRFSPQNKVLLTIRFSKASRALIAGDAVALLKKLASEFEMTYIRDCETNREIDPGDASWLHRTVSYAKYDFEYYFPVRRHNVRSRDVFCAERRDWPADAGGGLV